MEPQAQKGATLLDLRMDFWPCECPKVRSWDSRECKSPSQELDQSAMRPSSRKSIRKSKSAAEKRRSRARNRSRMRPKPLTRGGRERRSPSGGASGGAAAKKAIGNVRFAAASRLDCTFAAPVALACCSIGILRSHWALDGMPSDIGVVAGRGGCFRAARIGACWKSAPTGSTCRYPASLRNKHPCQSPFAPSSAAHSPCSFMCLRSRRPAKRTFDGISLAACASMAVEFRPQT